MVFKPLVVLGAALAVAAATVTTAVAAPSDNAGEAFNGYAGCVAASERSQVLFLLDESGSLKQTDPTGQRLVAAKLALAGLRDLASSSSVKVDVAVAGFGVNFNPAAWQSLSKENLETPFRSLSSEIEGFRNRNTSIDTDYYAALAGAQAELARRGAAVGGQQRPCQAILWFTDGKYDIEDRLSSRTRATGTSKSYAPEIKLDRRGGGEALRAKGRSLLCSGGGVVDQLRSEEIPIFAVALSGQIAPEDMDLLGAVANGSGGGVTCGTKGSAITGAVLAAENLGDLLSAFDRAASEIARGTRDPGQDQTAICANSACPEGTRTFELDDSLHRFHVLARSDIGGLVVQIGGPGSTTPVDLARTGAQEATVGGVPIRWQWVSDKAVVVDGSNTPSGQGWEGTWSVTFIDPTGTHPGALARSQIYLFSDLIPKLVGPHEVETDTSAKLRFTIVSDVDGKERPNASGTFTASVLDPSSGRSTNLVVERGDDGQYQATYDVPEDAPAAGVAVTARFVAKTKRDLGLAPSVQTFPLGIRIPGLPRIRLTQSRLVPIHGEGTSLATAEITADRRAGACVWFQGGDATSPKNAGRIKLRPTSPATSPTTCLKVAAGQRARFEVEIEPEGTANGTVQGHLTLMAKSDTSAEAHPYRLAFEVPLTRAINKAKQVGVFLSLLLPGLLVPLLIAYIGNWWTARFRGHRLARSALLDLEIEDGIVRRSSTRSPLLLTPEDFDENLPLMGRAVREFDHRGHSFRTRMSLSPFAAPHALASTPGRNAVGNGRRSVAPPNASVGLAVPGMWVVSAPTDEALSSDRAVQLRLLIFVGEDRSPSACRMLSDQLHDRLPAALEALIALAPERKKVTVGGPWDDEHAPPAANEEPPPW